MQLLQQSTTLVAAEAKLTSTVTAFGYNSYDSQESIKSIDPMIYWGCKCSSPECVTSPDFFQCLDLVKAQFMAGELYALSLALIEFIATDLTVASMVCRKEDKLVS